MAKARHITYLREERSTCRVRSSRRDPKICEIPLFFTPLFKNLTKPLQKLSKTSLFSLTFHSEISTFWPQILHFLTPGIWEIWHFLTPGIWEIWHFLTPGIWEIFTFWGHFLSLFQFSGSLFVTFSVFGVTFSLFEIRGHFLSLFWSKNALFNH